MISMSYQTNRAKIINFANDKIVPLLKEKDLEYKEVVQIISENVGCSSEMVIDGLKTLIPNKIKEIHVLTIPDEEVTNWLRDRINKEKECKPMEEHEVDAILRNE